jgi:hypothetical protein
VTKILLHLARITQRQLLIQPSCIGAAASATTWSSIFDLVPLLRTNDRSGTTTFPSAQTGVPLHAHLIEKLYQKTAAEQSVAARVCLRTRLRERRLSVWESSTSRHTQDAETRVRSGLLCLQEVPPVVKLLPGTASDSHVRAKRSAS